jgi:hypothetical protein
MGGLHDGGMTAPGMERQNAQVPYLQWFHKSCRRIEVHHVPWQESTPRWLADGGPPKNALYNPFHFIDIRNYWRQIRLNKRVTGKFF